MPIQRRSPGGSRPVAPGLARMRAKTCVREVATGPVRNVVRVSAACSMPVVAAGLAGGDVLTWSVDRPVSATWLPPE